MHFEKNIFLKYFDHVAYFFEKRSSFPLFYFLYFLTPNEGDLTNDNYFYFIELSSPLRLLVEIGGVYVPVLEPETSRLFPPVLFFSHTGLVEVRLQAPFLLKFPQGDPFTNTN